MFQIKKNIAEIVISDSRATFISFPSEIFYDIRSPGKDVVSDRSLKKRIIFKYRHTVLDSLVNVAFLVPNQVFADRSDDLQILSAHIAPVALQFLSTPFRKSHKILCHLLFLR